MGSHAGASVGRVLCSLLQREDSGDLWNAIGNNPSALLQACREWRDALRPAAARRCIVLVSS